jgi:serine/threonine protein kinase
MCNLTIPQLTIGLHTHGIIHTDIKPENVALVKADVEHDMVLMTTIMPKLTEQAG